jgi:hypothetical protein
LAKKKSIRFTLSKSLLVRLENINMGCITGCLLYLTKASIQNWLNPVTDKALIWDIIYHELDIALDFIKDNPRLSKAGWEQENSI